MDDSPRLLTEADIAAVDDLQEETIEVPEWGGAVTLRQLSIEETLSLDTGDNSREASKESGMRMLALCMGLSEAGVAVLQRKSSAVVVRLITAAARINGMDEKAVERAERSFPDEPAQGVPVPADEGPGLSVGY